MKKGKSKAIKRMFENYTKRLSVFVGKNGVDKIKPREWNVVKETTAIRVSLMVEI